MFVAEQFTGQPGVFVPLDETISSFKALTEGKYDNLPEQAFFMVGGIEDVESKARELEQVTLQVALVVPEGELWAGPASMVIAKTLDGDIGVLTGHSPVLGILAEGSVVRIRPRAARPRTSRAVRAAVSGGFLSVADDRVSILAASGPARRPTSTPRPPAPARRRAAERGGLASGPEEPADVRYFRALLRAAGNPPTGPDESQRGEGRGWPGAAGARRCLAPRRRPGHRARAGAIGIAVRRTLIERGGGSVECGLRRARAGAGGSGWPPTSPTSCAGTRSSGSGCARSEVFARRTLSVVSRRPADPVEMTSVGAGAVVVECDTGEGAAPDRARLSEDALTGFLAWLEAAPPGSTRSSVAAPPRARPAQRSPPGFHSTSPWPALACRARMNSRSDSRFRYRAGSGLTVSP